MGKNSIRILTEQPNPKNAEVAHFFAYLLGLSSNGRAPSKTDVRPEKLGAALNSVWLYHLDHETDEFVCDLAGQKFVDILGVNPMHKPLARIFRPDVYKALNQAWRDMIREEVYSYQCGTGTEEGTPVERLMFPLYDKEDRLIYIYGISDYSGTTRTSLEVNPIIPDKADFFAFN